MYIELEISKFDCVLFPSKHKREQNKINCYQNIKTKIENISRYIDTKICIFKKKKEKKEKRELKTLPFIYFIDLLWQNNRSTEDRGSLSLSLKAMIVCVAVVGHQVHPSPTLISRFPYTPQKVQNKISYFHNFDRTILCTYKASRKPMMLSSSTTSYTVPSTSSTNEVNPLPITRFHFSDRIRVVFFSIV